MLFPASLKALALGAVLAAAPTLAAPTRANKVSAKAVYFMTNEAQNSIVALPVQKNGTLSEGTITATGGKGLQEVSAKTGQPNAPDGLSSQGSVRVAGDNLFVVNAGDNTVSMFKIDAADPTKLTMVGQPVDTKGDFPVTMAVSMRHSMACVANTGTRAGVACSKITREGLVAMDVLRPLTFDLQQSNPPTGPLNSVADVLFSEDESVLYTMVKGNMTSNQPGGVAAFPVDCKKGQVSQTAVSNKLNGTAVLFGTVPIPGTNSLVATDASFGAAILEADSKGTTLSVKAKTAVPDQKATCWAEVSAFTKTAFLTDVLVNHLVEMDIQSGALIQVYNLTTPQTGMIDLATAGKNIFGLAPSANTSTSVQVFDVSGGRGKAKQIQNFIPQGVSATAQGMAVFM